MGGRGGFVMWWMNVEEEGRCGEVSSSVKKSVEVRCLEKKVVS